MGILRTEELAQTTSNDNRLTFINESTLPYSFLSEDSMTYERLDSCFANIFMCESRKNFIQLIQ